MVKSVDSASKLRFGLFEVDLHAETLSRSGARIKVQNQPFQVLVLLLERHGEIVSREEMRRRLWGDQTTVDFDHGLGIAINKLRETLGDSAENPRFIETIARHGYRFIAPISEAPAPADAPAKPPGLEPQPAASAQPRAKPASARKWRAGFIVLGICFLLALLWGAEQSWPRPAVIQTPLKVSPVTFSGMVYPGLPLQESFAAMVTDGSRIYFQQINNGRVVLAQALISDGQATALDVPSEIQSPALGSLSPDNSKLLVRDGFTPQSEQPLWIIPTLGGTARKFSNVLAHDATWMPNGRQVLYAAQNKLYVANDDGTGSRLFATLPGRAFWLRWSPDGSKLRFTLVNPLDYSTSLWQISSSGKDLHPLLPGWSHPASECCGSWTADGRYYVFQSDHSGTKNIWALSKKSFLDPFRSGQPIQVTNGPLSYRAPLPAASGDRIFFTGKEVRSALLKYEPASSRFVSYGETPSAAQVITFSRDGRWVAWINPADSTLWRSRSDGSQRLQLTTRPVQVFTMHWSPNDQRIALMGREPGQPWKIYLISAQGGELTPAMNEKRNEADPDWSPDGQHLVFGRLPDVMAEQSLPKAIHILDLRTHRISLVPGSSNLFSPRWSPNGRYIAALTIDENKVMLFDMATRKWKTLVPMPAHDPSWSHDSRWIYFLDFLGKDQPIYRVSVPGGKLERVADMSSLRSLGVEDFRFAGLTPGDVPLVNAFIATSNIYSAELGRR